MINKTELYHLVRADGTVVMSFEGTFNQAYKANERMANKGYKWINDLLWKAMTVKEDDISTWLQSTSQDIL